MTNNKGSLKVIATTLLGAALIGTSSMVWSFIGQSLDARASRIVDVKIGIVKKEHKIESTTLKKDIIDRLDKIDDTQRIIIQRLMRQ